MISVPLVLLFSVIAGLLSHIFIPIIWFILSRWLEGRALIIACVSTSIALGMGGAGYAGPANILALAAVVEMVTTIAAGLAIAWFWLRRHEERIGG